MQRRSLCAVPGPVSRLIDGKGGIKGGGGIK